MNRKSYFFIGHREANERLLPELIDAIERLITEEQVFCLNRPSLCGQNKLGRFSVTGELPKRGEYKKKSTIEKFLAYT